MSNSQLRLIIVLLGSIFLSDICHGAPRPRWRTEISIYDHENYRGITQTITLGKRCKNLGGSFRNKISSIRLHSGCVQLCRKEHCDQCTAIQESYPALSEINLNDRIRSIMRCDQHYNYKFQVVKAGDHNRIS